MKDKPCVSVIMSTYNEEKRHLNMAVSSILSQTFIDYEFLIVLDNPDNVMIKDLMEEYAKADYRIRIIYNERNIGLTASLNKAIGAACGQYLFRMDADDVIVKECIEKEILYLQQNNLDLVAASKINIDEDGRELKSYVNDFSPEILRKLLPYDNSINHPTVLMKKDVFDALGGYREIQSCEDYDLWMRMLCSGCRMAIMPDKFLMRRVRTGSVCEGNPYQLHLSRKFIRKIYKCIIKQDNKILTEKDYKTFIARQNVSAKKQERFNKAYKTLYKAFDKAGRGNIVKSFAIILLAVMQDAEVLLVLLEKLSYQVRKKRVLREGQNDT